MSVSTIVVALNAQLLRRVDLRPRRPTTPPAAPPAPPCPGDCRDRQRHLAPMHPLGDVPTMYQASGKQPEQQGTAGT